MTQMLRQLVKAWQFTYRRGCQLLQELDAHISGNLQDVNGLREKLNLHTSVLHATVNLAKAMQDWLPGTSLHAGIYGLAFRPVLRQVRSLIHRSGHQDQQLGTTISHCKAPESTSLPMQRWLLPIRITA